MEKGQEKDNSIQTLGLVFKQQQFNIFISLKYAFQSILHRQIVHKIQEKYLNRRFSIEIKSYKQEDNQDNFQQLSENLFSIHKLKLNMNNYLRNNNEQNSEKVFILLSKCTVLQSLDLHSRYNKIGTDNINFIKKTLSSLSTLKHLSLGLCDNELGSSVQNMEKFASIFKKLSSLLTLKLDLQYNMLYSGQKKLAILARSFYSLKRLQQLRIFLQYNNLGNKIEIFKPFFEGISNLISLDTFVLYIETDFLQENSIVVQNLIENLAKLKNLRTIGFVFSGILKSSYNKQLVELISGIENCQSVSELGVNLSQCRFGQDKECFRQVCQAFTQLQEQIGFLKLHLCTRGLVERKENIRELFFMLQSLKCLRKLDLSLVNNSQVRRSYNFVEFLKGLPLLKNLKCLGLNLDQNGFGGDAQNIQFLSLGLESLQFLGE